MLPYGVHTGKTKEREFYAVTIYNVSDFTHSVPKIETKWAML